MNLYLVQNVNTEEQQLKRKYNKKQYEKINRQLRPRQILNTLVALPQIGNHPLWNQAKTR